MSVIGTRSAGRLLGALMGGALLLAACTPDNGAPGATTTTTTAPPSGPLAVASATPVVGDAPLDVTFGSTGSRPALGSGVTYLWDFGDGTPVGSGTSVAHTYQNPGTYSATLVVTSAEGTATSTPVSILVNVDPNPKFYVKVGGASGPACGPIAQPCGSIDEAQTNAIAAGVREIHVTGGTFPGPLALVSNMTVIGGWAQDFSGFDVGEITTIYGTGTAPAITATGIVNSTIAGISAQGVERTSGDAVGILVTGGSNGVAVGSTDAPETIVSGGIGPNATGVLVAQASSVRVVNAKVNSGSTVGVASSAYGVRAIGQSVVQVTLSDVTAQAGTAGAAATDAVPNPARSGTAGGNGDNACGAGCPGAGGDGGN